MKKTILACAVLAACGSAGADEGSLNISGFGSLGVAKSNTNEAQFVRYNQAEGIGDHARIGLDTNLGLQASYGFNERLSGTVQVLTRKNTSPTFTTDLTWAFLKYKATDELNVRVGRVALPVFMISDYQNVGYANTMMRPPVEMYAQAPIESADGIDFNYQRALGDTTLNAQGVLGVSRGKLFLVSTGTVATYRAPVRGLSVSAEHGPLTLRASWLGASMSSNDITPVNALAGTLRSVGFGQLGDDLAVSGKKMTFAAVGATLDWNKLLLQAEYGQRRAKDKVYIPSTNSWYAMAGYRIGKVLPYYTHAAAKGAGTSITLPAGFPASGALSSAVRGALTASEQSSDTLGVRWDFAKSVDLKVQVDRVHPHQRNGMLIYAPATGLQRSVTVAAASLDFVF
ncbi:MULTISPECIES: porin [unclassified Duganella]|uniref:porin n=1 Tax=unclassified Duganella TaxID=2636909 RepID=UPI000E34A562|nr:MULTISPECIES: porin [unclassified Duganella]RFP18745.1 porin [Duganella sp. BJB475]RFP35410.1 porin [Duganella sp. BJB476]